MATNDAIRANNNAPRTNHNIASTIVCSFSWAARSKRLSIQANENGETRATSATVPLCPRGAARSNGLGHPVETSVQFSFVRRRPAKGDLRDHHIGSWRLQDAGIVGWYLVRYLWRKPQVALITEPMRVRLPPLPPIRIFRAGGILALATGGGGSLSSSGRRFSRLAAGLLRRRGNEWEKVSAAS